MGPGSRASSPGAGAQKDRNKLLGKLEDELSKLQNVGNFEQDFGWTIFFLGVSVKMSGKLETSPVSQHENIALQGLHYKCCAYTSGNLRVDAISHMQRSSWELVLFRLPAVTVTVVTVTDSHR